MHDKSEKLLILFNSVPYFLSFLNREGVIGSWTFREIPVYLKAIRKITRWLNISQEYWYGAWKNSLKSIDTVIIFAPLEDIGVLEFIKRSNPEIRIIYWYWNPVFRVGEIKTQASIERWSFDPADCVKHAMRFNTTFYFKDVILPNNTICFDTVFVGNDKGRSAYLSNLGNILEALGLKTYFHVVPDKKGSNKKQIQMMSYGEYLELISKAKAIIDVVPDGQSGLTVRSMESIFFKKKLITSDETIANQNFYNKNNIFIVGRDDQRKLTEFINSPYFPIDQSILDHYDLSCWLERFNR